MNRAGKAYILWNTDVLAIETNPEISALPDRHPLSRSRRRDA